MQRLRRRCGSAQSSDKYHRLYANAKADDDALRELANARAEAVKHAIVATGIADERLFLIAPRIGDGPRNTGGAAPALSTRVELALR